MNPLLHTMLAFLKVSYRMVRITLRNNKNLPGTEQTALDVIAWVRSQVYRQSRRACADLLIKTCDDETDEGTYVTLLHTYVYLFIGCLVGWYE